MSAMNFGQAQSRYDSMLPLDDIYERMEARAAREEEAIRDDPERLLEAVYETDIDEAEKLAELRIVLSNAAGAIDMLTHGDSLDVAMNHPARAQAMRELFRAVETAERIVTERVKQAAEESA
jgi:hypothetical protein